MEPEQRRTTIIEIKPMGKVRRTHKDKFRPAHLRYNAYYRELVLKARGLELPEVLNVTFVIPMPKSYFNPKGKLRKGKPCEGDPHRLKPDLDNLIKGVQDALAKNDQHVHTYENCKKVWGLKGMIIITH